MPRRRGAVSLAESSKASWPGGVSADSHPRLVIFPRKPPAGVQPRTFADAGNFPRAGRVGLQRFAIKSQ